MNWTQVLVDLLISIIGAFTGVLGALFVENKKDKKRHLQKNNQIMKSLLEELVDINNATANLVEQGSVLDYKISIPAWDAVVNAGILLDLVELPFYSQVIAAYSAIERFNDKFEKADVKAQTELQKDVAYLTAQVGEEVERYTQSRKTRQ